MGKTPRLFRQPLSQTRFQSRLYKRIFLTPDKEFLSSITEVNAEGMVVLNPDATGDDLKRLTKLLKTARKNRGALRTGRFMVIGTLVAGVLVFSLFFKDRLVERAAESLLERLFLARVELSDVRFRPVRGELSFASLAIANARRPMENLVETESGILHINTWELLTGSAVIEEVSVQGFALATPREQPGSLSNDDESTVDSDSDPAQESSSPGALSEIASRLSPVAASISGDAAQFVADATDSLRTPAMVAELQLESELLVTEASDTLATIRAKVVATGTDAQALSQTDFAGISSVQEVIALQETVRSVVDQTQSLLADAQAAYDTIGNEVTSLTARFQEATGGVQTDIQYIRDLVPRIEPGGATTFIADLLRPYVMEVLGVWYGRIVQANAVVQRLQSLESSESDSRNRREGDRISFIPDRYPRFFLETARFAGSTNGERTIAIRNLSSDPDQSDTAVALEYMSATEGRMVSLSVQIDGRTEPEALLNGALETSGLPIELKEGLDTVGIDRVGGTATVTSAVAMQPDGSVAGDMMVTLTQLEMTRGPDSGTVADLVVEAVTQVGIVEAGFAFSADRSGQLVIADATTNLDSMIDSAMKSFIDEALADFRVRVEAQAAALLDGYLADAEAAILNATGVSVEADALLALATDRDAAARRIQDELTNKGELLREQVEAQVREEAQRVANEAEQAARDAAAEAAAEAQDRVQDAVEDQVNTIRGRLGLP